MENSFKLGGWGRHQTDFRYLFHLSVCLHNNKDTIHVSIISTIMHISFRMKVVDHPQEPEGGGEEQARHWKAPIKT